MRVIKRYSNRKLYDTKEKRYITLDRIAELVETGEQVQVIDNDSGEDQTGMILSQIVFKKEKDQAGSMPKVFLSELIKGKNTMYGFIRQTINNWFGTDEDSIDQNIERMVEDGELSKDEGLKLKEEILQKTRQYVDRLDKKVEEKVTELLAHLNLPRKSDFEKLQSRIDELTTKYQALVERVRRPKTPGDGEA